MKKILNNLVHYLFWGVTCIFFWRVREVSVNDKPYLRRFYLFKRKGKFFNFPFAVYLHYFHNGDEEFCLHNHPWTSSRSLVLTGGYTEFKRLIGVDPSTGKTSFFVMPRAYTPGKINKIDQDDYHKISLDRKFYGKHTWTIFFANKRISGYEERIEDWNFWDPIKNVLVPHGKFLKQRHK